MQKWVIRAGCAGASLQSKYLEDLDGKSVSSGSSLGYTVRHKPNLKKDKVRKVIRMKEGGQEIEKKGER